MKFTGLCVKILNQQLGHLYVRFFSPMPETFNDGSSLPNARANNYFNKQDNGNIYELQEVTVRFLKFENEKTKNQVCSLIWNQNTSSQMQDQRLVFSSFGVSPINAKLESLIWKRNKKNVAETRNETYSGPWPDNEADVWFKNDICHLSKSKMISARILFTHWNISHRRTSFKQTM